MDPAQSDEVVRLVTRYIDLYSLPRCFQRKDDLNNASHSPVLIKMHVGIGSRARGNGCRLFQIITSFSLGPSFISRLQIWGILEKVKAAYLRQVTWDFHQRYPRKRVGHKKVLDSAQKRYLYIKGQVPRYLGCYIFSHP